MPGAQAAPGRLVNVNGGNMLDRVHQRAGRRAALELRVPGRDGKPDRAVPYGELRTATGTWDKLSPGSPAVIYQTPLGDFQPMQRRKRRPDGARAAFVAPKLTEGARFATRSDCLTESAVRFDVLRALVRSGELVVRPGVRVQFTLTRAVMTIPDKGKVLKWASVEDLVQAISQGAF